MKLYQQSKAVFLREVRSEFRTKHSITSVVYFVVISIAIIAFSSIDVKVEQEVLSSLVWIVMFFTAMTALSKTFIQEEERKTRLFLQVNTSPLAVYWGKLGYNSVVSISMNILLWMLFMVLLNYTSIKEYTILFLFIPVISIALAASTTLLSALVAQAGSRTALLPVLSFPISVPLIMNGVSVTQKIFVGGDFFQACKELLFLCSYTGILIVLSIFLFEYIWKE